MSWSILELAPFCNDLNCPQYGKDKHLTDVQQAILDSPAKFSYDQGGFGSTKTFGGVLKHFLLMATIPGNRGVVARESLPKLHDTTQRIYQEVLQRYEDLTGVELIRRENRDGFSHHVIIPGVGSEIFFRPSNKIGLGQEYGAILIDEAQEEPKSTFTNLMSRLRLPAAGSYLWFGLLSNPPRRGSWLHEVFGEKPGQFRKGGSLYELRISSTRNNPHLPHGYVEDLIATHGHEQARRILDGLYSFEAEGKAVYMPPFDHGRHVGEVTVDPKAALIRSWDFGFRHPAVTWNQSFICKSKTVHWRVLAEVTDVMDKEASYLADRVLADHKNLFPNHPRQLVLDCGDRAGVNVKDTSPGAIIVLGRAPFYLRFKYGKFEIADGVDLITRRLRVTCPCGQPIILVDRRCTGIIEMFAGGYHWPKDRPQVGPKDNPRKDHYYDDIADSLRYYCENYIRPQLLNSAWMGELLRDKENSGPEPQPWEWMEGRESGPVYAGARELKWAN